MLKEPHFTAIIQIKKTVTESSLTASRSSGKPDDPIRQIVDIANLTVRSDSLDKLTEKCIAHLGLIEE